jgi:hypothetical protein
MTTTFHFHLILQMNRRRSGVMEQLHGPTGKKIPAPAGIDVH